jgi:hypothetical protein
VPPQALQPARVPALPALSFHLVENVARLCGCDVLSMKSLLFCTSYIRDAEAWKQRYQRWLDYYANGPIDADFRIMIDDGSPYLPPPDVIQTVHHAAPLALAGGGSALVHFDDNLGRQSISAYPGWWRSFLHSLALARELGADKIIHIESDAYILSPRLADYINGVAAGWHVMWTERCQFPETAIQVICRDQFDALERFKARQPDLNYGEIAEKILPFTTVARQFKGDRYSEMRKNRGIFRSRKFDRIPLFQTSFFTTPIPADADFVTQAIPTQRLAFRKV